MPPTNKKLKAQAINLRVEERLSYSEIHDILGVSKGTLSGWLSPYPLTDGEKRAKMGGHGYRAPKKKRGEESLLHQQMSPKGQSRLWKAKVAEAAVMLRLVIHGFHPFGSMFDGDKTDWLVEDPRNGKVHKIQVKWAAPVGNHGLPLIRLQCRDGHAGFRQYREGEFDFVVGYDYFTDTAYVWSWDEVRGMTRKTIETDAQEAWSKMG